MNSEIAILSQLIKDNDTALIFDRVKEKDFSDPVNRDIFLSMRSIWEEGKTIDLVTADERCNNTDFLVDLGSEFFPNTEQYIDLLKQGTVRRELKELLKQTFDMIDTEDPSEVLGVLESGINKALEFTDDELRVSEILKEDIWEDQEKVYTGYRKLDELTMGFGNGDLIIVAGRPGVGKTTLALNIALNSGVPTAIFSLEMKKKQITQNLVSMLGNLPRSCYDTTLGKVLAARGEELLSLKELMVDDNTGADVFSIKARSQALKNKGAKMIIVDYLQLIRGVNSDTRTRENEVSAISRGLKLLAMQLDIPVVVLSQLNRAVEHRKGHKPVLADLRESGAIEQDADKVVLLSGKHDTDFSIINTEVAKNRVGPTGSTKITFWKSCCKFIRDERG